MAYSDRELLARLIRCEAGREGVNVMKAVAGTVMNRVRARGGQFAQTGMGSIRRIILQPGEFDFACAEDDACDSRGIDRVQPRQIHYVIADWAIAGNRLAPAADSLWYDRVSSLGCPAACPSGQKGYLKTRIGGLCFYNPTSAYYET